MFLQRYYLECLSHASYMVADQRTKVAAVIDPRRDIDIYIDDAKEHGFKIKHVILTHFHADFVAGHIELRDKVGARIYLGAHAKAEFDFDALFIKKDIPDDIPEYTLSSAESLVSIMVGNNLVSSNGDAKRMIKQGAVKLDDEKVSDMFLEISPDSEKVLKVGKRKFLRITV